MRSNYQVAKKFVDILTAIGFIGAITVLALINIDSAKRACSFLSIFFLIMAIIAFCLREGIKIKSNKIESIAIDKFDSYVYDEKFNKGNEYGNGVRVIRLARIKRISQDEDSNITIILSSENCIEHCHIESNFASKEVLQHLLPGSTISLSYHRNDMKALLIHDGFSSHVYTKKATSI